MQTQLTKAFPSDISISEGERAVVAKISTSAVDRDGDVLIPQGAYTKDFERNPVVYLAHQYYTMPIGKAVSLRRTDDAIVAKTVFASRPESHPVGQEWVPDTIFDLYKQGVLRGWSVGLTIVESRPPTKRDLEKYGEARRIVSKWNLVEYSVAPIPANQDALTLAVAKGYLRPDAAKSMFRHESTGPVRVRIVIPR